MSDSPYELEALRLRDQQLVGQVRQQLKAAGESVWQRKPLVTTFPSFRSAPLAAKRLMGSFPECRRWLVLRDQSLRAVREEVLRQGYELIVPQRTSAEPLRIPQAALTEPGGVLIIDPLPRGAEPYCGQVDIVVVACHAFDPLCPRLYALDSCRTERLLDEYADGLESGFCVPATVPVICLASDAQQVCGWPTQAEGHSAHMVVTSTRAIELPWAERFPSVGTNTFVGDQHE